MKKITVICSIFLTISMNAQTLDNIPLKDIDVEYMQILGVKKLFSNKVSITVDFGQRTKLFSIKDKGTLRDENGKIMNLNSMIDALNFFSKNGYDFVTAYIVTIGKQNVYHYLLKKRK